MSKCHILFSLFFFSISPCVLAEFSINFLDKTAVLVDKQFTLSWHDGDILEGVDNTRFHTDSKVEVDELAIQLNVNWGLSPRWKMAMHSISATGIKTLTHSLSYKLDGNSRFSWFYNAKTASKSHFSGQQTGFIYRMVF
ncbi:MAG: hypothetical protein HRU20_22725 [Pseudomonadales bacterium]|nr:hypothetical protein [Pseudomonadales bacterium]